MKALANYRISLIATRKLNEPQRAGAIEKILNALNAAPEAQALIQAFDEPPLDQMTMI